MNGYDDMIAAKHAAQERERSPAERLLSEATARAERAEAECARLRVEVAQADYVIRRGSLDTLRAEIETLTREREAAVTERDGLQSVLDQATAHALAPIEAALGEHATGNPAADVRRVVERHDHWRDGAIREAQKSLLANGALRKLRSALRCPEGDDVVDWATRVVEIADGRAPCCVEERDRLRAYLARALRGCDARERVAIEADMAREASE